MCHHLPAFVRGQQLRTPEHSCPCILTPIFPDRLLSLLADSTSSWLFNGLSKESPGEVQVSIPFEVFEVYRRVGLTLPVSIVCEGLRLEREMPHASATKMRTLLNDQIILNW